MPLFLIAGTYKIQNSEPDGDSVRFYPDDHDAFAKCNLKAHANASGGVQLRLDAIDALETHYTPRVHGGTVEHQPAEYADAAAAELLKLLGFRDVVRNGQRVTSARPDSTPGYILTKFVDKYGRPVSLAYSGESPGTDLSSVYVRTTLAKRSVNYRLLAAGLVYPTFYSQFYVDLREAFTAAASRARDDESGLWSKDRTNRGVHITSATTLTDDAVILPKLFRRLADYLALNDGDLSLAGFKTYLATLDDRVWIASKSHNTGLDYVVDVRGRTVKLTELPENLVFVEK
jgi:endonuclease YncB( thermonuclease family)